MARLSGGLAHEFNNLLTTILGNCGTCLELPEAHGRMQEGLLAIRSAGERAAALTRQVLAYGRRQVLEPKAVDLNALVESAAERFRARLDPSILVQTALAPGLAPVRVDPAQLELALLNLALNAQDAMPSGGSLTLATRKGPEGFGLPEGALGSAVLEIRDTGIGMDAAIQARIFDPFFTTKPLSRGAGLGLSAVEGIVIQSGGEIHVASRPGMGTTFRITLPLAGMPPPSAPAPVPATNGTLLLVEDEEIVRRFCRIVLQLEGYRVLEASDGRSALAVLQAATEPIHLLLTDLIMPGMPGQVLAGHFLDMQPAGGVILMSAFPKAAAEHGISHPRVSFLQKPFLGGALADKVRKAMAATERAVEGR